MMYSDELIFFLESEIMGLWKNHFEDLFEIKATVQITVKFNTKCIRIYYTIGLL